MATPDSKPGRVTKVITVDEQGSPQSEYSQQIPDDPFGKSYRHQGIQEPPHNLENLMVLAEQHPTHSAILEQKAADIVGTGWEWHALDKDKQDRDTAEKDKLEAWFAGLADNGETDDTTHEILLAAWDDVETFGQGFIELSRDTNGKLRYWYRAPAHTFRFATDGIRILQKRGNKQKWFKRWIPGDERVVHPSKGQILDTAKELDKGEKPGNELIVLRRQSRRSTWYGAPKYISATGWIALSLAARDDNIAFFSNHREPRWAIILENVEDDPGLEDMIAEAFRKQLKEPHRNIIIPIEGAGKITFQKLGTDSREGSWEKMQDAIDARILLAHRMPGERVGMVRSGPLGGNAVTAATGVYKEGFVKTSQEILTSRINKFIEVESEIDKPKWKWNPVELDLSEEGAKEESAVRTFQGGLTFLNEGREEIGEEPLEDDDPRGKKFYFELTGGAPGLPPDANALAAQNSDLAGQIEQLIASPPPAEE